MDRVELNELIARAQERKPAAFDALVEHYGPRLYGYFYRATGHRADSEDLLAELFVRLVAMIGEYQHDGRFDAWLFRIATNLIRDRIRRSRTSRVVGAQTAEQDGYLESIADDEATSPLERLGQAEQLDQLGRALTQLPEAERTVVLLRHFSQLSFREIAELMDTPLGTALARGHRALARLRELMEEDGPGGTASAEHGRADSAAEPDGE